MLNCTGPYQTIPTTITPYQDGSSTILQPTPQFFTAIDQDLPESPILGSTEESTPPTFLRNRPPQHFVFIPLQGRPPHVISAFSLFPSYPDKSFSSLFEDLEKVWNVNAAHIWTLACSDLERCFITAVCKRQIDYLDKLNNQLASAQTQTQVQTQIKVQQMTNTLWQQFVNIKLIDNWSAFFAQDFLVFFIRMFNLIFFNTKLEVKL